MLVEFRCGEQGLCTPVHLEISLESYGQGRVDQKTGVHDGCVAPGAGLATEMWHILG